MTELSQQLLVRPIPVHDPLERADFYLHVATVMLAAAKDPDDDELRDKCLLQASCWHDLATRYMEVEQLH